MSSSERRSQPPRTVVTAIEAQREDHRHPPASLPRELRERLRQRDRSALETFYEAYFDRVYGYVRRMLGDDSQAEDVTQEVFLAIQRSIGTYDPERPLSPWVFTIATNQVRDHWRARARVDPLEGSSLDEEDARPDPPARDAGPLPALERAELGRTLSAAIDALPESLRTTLVLRQEGLSFEEIAGMVGRNEPAVRKRYSRALEELRQRLSRASAGIPEGGAA